MSPRRARPDRPRSIAVITRGVFPLHGVGGLERHVFDLIRHHLSAGLDVRLITRPANAQPTDERALASWSAIVSHPNFSLTTVPYRTFPLAGRKGTTILDRSTAYPRFGRRAGQVAAEAVRAGNADVVYALGASAYGYALAKRRGEVTAPLVLNPQGLEEFGGADGSYGGQRLKGLAYQPLRRVVRACAAEADAVIATDRALEPVVTRHLAVERSRLRLVPNGIDVAGCDALAGQADGQRVRGAAGLAHDRVVLLSVGRLERNKGFDHLAGALGRLRERRDWHWVIAGTGPYRRTIEEAIQHAGIERRVQWLGRIEDRDLHAWYEAADLFVHPTVYEGSSLVTLEAMTHRRPVVASRAGGLPDKVQPGTTGWLVAPGDPAALAGALNDALQQRENWPAMGAAGRRLVESTFDWTIVGRALVRVYDELLEINAARSR